MIKHVPDFGGIVGEIRHQRKPKHCTVATLLVIEHIGLEGFAAVLRCSGKQKLPFLNVKASDMKHTFRLAVFSDIQIVSVAAEVSQSAAVADLLGVDFLRIVGFVVINPASVTAIQRVCL